MFKEQISHFDLDVKFLEKACLVGLMGTEQSSHTQNIFLSRFTRAKHGNVNDKLRNTNRKKSH